MDILALATNHFFISGSLVVALVLLSYVGTSKKLYQLLYFLLLLNFFSYNGVLLATGTYDFREHLPLHLCYVTELGILVSLVLKNKAVYPWLVLNALGGGITGFTNSNIIDGSQLVEYTHLYLSHFNLLLFSVIAYKDKIVISRSEFIKSIILNAFIFSVSVVFNVLFQSNYWFTSRRPDGVNLTNILPDWPYYLLGLITIGLASYFITFKIFSRKELF
ncbi:MAG: hypothetical protein CBD58_03290 [bacterium TMED198]|nr:MAG: hypothetical protein CBD58_03290 [bacterium TMED198]